MSWIILSLAVLAVTFAYLGWRWESNFKRPQSARKPLVSIIVAAYNSKKTLKKTLSSLSALDYPKKEIIVVNDSNDGISSLCKQFGAKLIQNKKRLGKAKAMNLATEKARGELFFFVDADTVVEKDCLTKLVPWFESDKKIAAVSPKYVIQNNKNFLSKLISLEHAFLSNLFKIHMHFGSLIAFRGCGIAIRKSAFEKVGKWPLTLIEDMDMAMKLFNEGYKIQFDPGAVVKTEEAETWGELKKQRLRWGKGTMFSYLHYFKRYNLNIQFAVYLLPYIFLTLGILGALAYQTTLYMIPLFSVYLLYTLSIKEFFLISSLLVLPLFASTISNVATASVAHMAVISSKEKVKASDLLLVIPYVFVYFPYVIGCYAKGMIEGLRDKKNKRDEVDFRYW